MANVNSVSSGKSFTFNAGSTQRANCGGEPHRNFCSIPTQRSSMDNNSGTRFDLCYLFILFFISDGENESFVNQEQVLAILSILVLESGLVTKPYLAASFVSFRR